MTLNGADYAAVFGQSGTFTAREAGKEQSALILRDVWLATPGPVTVEVSDGTQSRTVTWTVYDTGARKAKNVILFIGDGMSPAHRVAARLLSKGIAEGKSRGKLAIDDMPHMALVATAGSDSIITDSANAASAYATGHKAAVNALGVYADRTPDPFDDPRVETIASLAKRQAGLAVGLVTNTEVEDATPAERKIALDDREPPLLAGAPDEARVAQPGGVGHRRGALGRPARVGDLQRGHCHHRLRDRHPPACESDDGGVLDRIRCVAMVRRARRLI